MQSTLLKITVMYGDQHAEIKVDKRGSMEELKVAIFSITNIAPEYQLITRDSLVLEDRGNDNQVINFFNDQDFIIVKALAKPFSSYNGDFSEVFTQGFENEIPAPKDQPACSEFLFEDGSCMMVKLINQDNSCMFSSIHYAENQNFNSCYYLREHVANIILANPHKFTREVLLKSPQEYADWIMQKNTWGGAIELQILAELIEKEIAVISINPWNIQIFGEEQNYRKRIYLVYNGAHYNMIVRNFSSGNANMDVTIFRAYCKINLDAASQAAHKFMTQNRENEDMVFYCRQCDSTILGKSYATAHGQETRHNQITQCM